LVVGSNPTGPTTISFQFIDSPTGLVSPDPLLLVDRCAQKCAHPARFPSFAALGLSSLKRDWSMRAPASQGPDGPRCRTAGRCARSYDLIWTSPLCGGYRPVPCCVRRTSAGHGTASLEPAHVQIRDFHPAREGRLVERRPLAAPANRLRSRASPPASGRNQSGRFEHPLPA
jgi:hypothetical protein